MGTMSQTVVWWWTSLVPLILVQIRPHVTSQLEEGICIRDISNLKIKSNRHSNDGFEQIPFIDDRAKIHYTQMAEASTVFVDKSLLIKKILEHKSKVVLINCPPKSGKSINLSMLKTFFEIRVRKRDRLNVMLSNETSTYKFFTRGEIINCGPHQYDSPLQPTISSNRVSRLNEKTENIFATYTIPPMIGKYKDIVDQHLAKYPVIYIDLSLEVWLHAPTIVEGMEKQICDLYKKYAFLKELLTPDTVNVGPVTPANGSENNATTMAAQNAKEFEFMEKACERNAKINLTEEDLENGVLTLSKILYHWLGGKQVIILVDEFIQPLEHYLLDEYQYYKGLQASQIRNGIRVLRNFMRKTFAENPFLKKAILTGNLSVNKKDLLTDIANFTHYNAIDNDLQAFYGFTENEVRMLCSHFNIADELTQEGLDYYNGYTMKPSTSNFATIRTFNVWSIASFANKRIIDDYWMQYVKTFDKMRPWLDISKLSNLLRPAIDDNQVLVAAFVELDFGIGKSLHSCEPQSTLKDDKPPRKVGKRSIDCILSLFCQLGLLTNDDHIEGRRDRRRTSIRLRIPNEEVRRAFEKYVPASNNTS